MSKPLLALPPPRVLCMLLDMGLPAEKPRRATYAELEAIPPHLIAEILNGELYVLPRPAVPHTRVGSRLGVKLGGPFDLGEGGPGGWHILDEPEIHLGPRGEEDVIVPDLAGWRVERLRRLPRTAFISLAPDWVCEILSPSTETVDRAIKMHIYAREGVRHLWLIHPLRQTLEVFALNAEKKWTMVDIFQGHKHVQAQPFDAIELHLALLWPDQFFAGDEDDEITPMPLSSSRKASKRPNKRSRK